MQLISIKRRSPFLKGVDTLPIRAFGEKQNEESIETPPDIIVKVGPVTSHHHFYSTLGNHKQLQHM